MDREPVTSSNIKSIGWDNQVLEVEFHNGDVYQYQGVSKAKHQKLMAEDTRQGGSVGAHFHRHVRTKHGFRKVSK